MCEDFMLQAISMGKRGLGRTSPNPMVGAVLVKNGQIIGQGFHPRAGEPHAEIFALREAAENAKGASLYTNLEPCCHFGLTPPCTQAIITAGVTEVHMAMLDPNPLVAGKGRIELEKAGIKTFIGSQEEEAKKLNEIYIHWITRKRPFVIAKFAMSLDGKISPRTGISCWITNETSRLEAHRVRDQVDAILVGVDTVIIDNPQLTTRLPQNNLKHPIRIILDSRGRIPHTAKVVDGSLIGKTIVATTEQSYWKDNLLKNAEIITLTAQDGKVDLSNLLQKLATRKITSVLVEGGPRILASFFSENLVDKVLTFIAPIVIGGKNAPSPVTGRGIIDISHALRLEKLEIKKLDEDLLISGYPSKLI